MAEGDVQVGGETAVIYFHGVGNPRRSTSLSKLLDCIDVFGNNNSGSGIGRPRKFQSVKSFNKLGEEELAGVRFNVIKKINKKDTLIRTVTAYEAYWAPLMTSKINILSLIFWMIPLLSFSIKINIENWRSYPGLKILNLLKASSIEGSSVRDIQMLEKLFRGFQNWDSRRKYKIGSIADFKAYCRSMAPSMKVQSGYLEKLVEYWTQEYRNDSRMAMKIAWRIVLAMLFTILIIFNISVKIVSNYIYQKDNIIVFGSLLTILLLYIFVNISANYLQDVIMWTRSSERGVEHRDRKGIVSYARNLIRSVCEDRRFDNVVIISHSLGSAIAIEAIVREARYQRSIIADGDPSVNKISGVFTIGSPIDVIYRFFQIHNRSSHRFNRVIEDEIISVCGEPFFDKNNKIRIKIVNFWSKRDPISSPLYSLRKRVSADRRVIQNIELSSPRWRGPLKAHTSYFEDNEVISRIYGAICKARAD